jgi:predicted kinase
VERKRLFGLRALDDSGAVASEAAVYGADATRRTYERLAEVAGASLQAGWPTIVDAAFLRSGERRSFARLAARLQVPFAIIACEAPPALLRQRVQARRARRDDPSEADVEVLRSLQHVHEPLDADEEALATTLHTSGPVDVAGLAGWWRSAAVASAIERGG